MEAHSALYVAYSWLVIGTKNKTPTRTGYLGILTRRKYSHGCWDGRPRCNPISPAHFSPAPAYLSLSSSLSRMCTFVLGYIRLLLPHAPASALMLVDFSLHDRSSCLSFYLAPCEIKRTPQSIRRLWHIISFRYPYQHYQPCPRV